VEFYDSDSVEELELAVEDDADDSSCCIINEIDSSLSSLFW
jgi:hypothetical protein